MPFPVPFLRIAMIGMLGALLVPTSLHLMKRAKASFSQVHDRNLTIPPEDLLTAAARAELKLPSNSDLTFGTKEDCDFVAKLTPETVKAVERSLKPTGRNCIICAARPVGNYLLLWIAFPEVADGGMDLIWSLERQKPVGTFVGGYRG